MLGLFVPCITTKFSTFIKLNEKWLSILYRMRHNVALSNTVQVSEFDVKYSYDLKGEFQIFLGALQNYCCVSSLLFYDGIHLDVS